jgi:ribonuclease D
MDILTSPSTYEMHPEDAYRRIKFRPRNSRQIAALREVAAWREREAQRRDMPRRRVLRDEALTELATQMPRTEGEMAQLRTISEGFARSRGGKGLLEALEKARALPDDALPPMPKRRKPGPDGASAIADILKLALKIVCERNHIAPRLIASAKDVERIAAGETDVPALKGWRGEVFGHLARALMKGEKVIAIRDGKPGIF